DPAGGPPDHGRNARACDEGAAPLRAGDVTGQGARSAPRGYRADPRAGHVAVAARRPSAPTAGAPSPRALPAVFVVGRRGGATAPHRQARRPVARASIPPRRRLTPGLIGLY